MNFLLVGLGGILGGISRYQLGKMISESVRTTFPVATFFINLCGAFLLGSLMAKTSGGSLYLLLGDGFLGAFTTFSTYMYESFSLFRENEKRNAIIYIVCSLLLGIVAYTFGFIVAETL
ncbi:MAG: fluoride efflux transporter CrcB [Eubacteriales bacterium]|nr:fluoride efflux transporter CrcB [Eubacteriales bacterium]MDD3349743.1 fluoride efflux transporter CrcB [Eubacteriales bacterium]